MLSVLRVRTLQLYIAYVDVTHVFAIYVMSTLDLVPLKTESKVGKRYRTWHKFSRTLPCF